MTQNWTLNHLGNNNCCNKTLHHRGFISPTNFAPHIPSLLARSKRWPNNVGFVAMLLSFIFPPPPSHHIPPHLTSFDTQPLYLVQPNTMHVCLPRRRPPQQSWGSAKCQMKMNCQSNAAAVGRTTVTTTIKKTPTNRLTTRNRPWRPKEGLERGESKGRRGHLLKDAYALNRWQSFLMIAIDWMWSLPPFVPTNDFHRKTAQDWNSEGAGLKSPPMSKQTPYISPPLSFCFF